MRSLGAFVGNLWAGVTSDAAKPVPKRLQSNAEEDEARTVGRGAAARTAHVSETERVAESEIEGRRVILRERVIREVEFVDDPGAPDPNRPPKDRPR